MFTYGFVKDGEVREATTLGVCWNLIGHEGNISSVAAGLLPSSFLILIP